MSALYFSVTVSAAETETIGNLEINGYSGGYTYEDDVLTITMGGTYTISNIGVGSVQFSNTVIVINSSDDVELYIQNVHLNNYYNPPLSITGSGNVNLILIGKNYFSADSSGSAALSGIKKTNTSSTLTISEHNGNGSLTATGGTNAPGISGSNIIIDSGTVTAIGGPSAAGIGGGNGENGSKITINGGTVTATGGTNAAGIGGGNGGNGYNITINGGTVTATGDSGAGIGGGNGGYGNYITINDGEITAESDSGAGIGGGNGSYGCPTIYGGTVTATSSSGAGIGGGYNGNVTNMYVSGGTVTATSSTGAGIGSGEGGRAYYVTVNGGEITAESSSGAGIGAGKGGEADHIYVTGGTVEATSTSGAGVGGSEGGSAYFVTIGGGTVTATSTSGAGVGSGSGSSCDTITIDGGDLTAVSSTGAGVGGGYNGSVSGITISGCSVTARSTDTGAGIGGGENGSASDITISSGTVTARSAGGGAGIGGGYNGAADGITITSGTVTSTAEYYGAGIGGGWLGKGTNITISGGYIKITANYGGDYIGSGFRGGTASTITITGGWFGEGSISDNTVYGIAVSGSGYVAQNTGSSTSADYPYVVTNPDVRAFTITGKGSTYSDLNEGSDYTYEDHVLTLYDIGTYYISMNTEYGITSTATDRIVVATPYYATAYIYLTDVNITSTTAAPFSMEEGHVYIRLSGDNYITSDCDEYAAIQKASERSTSSLDISSADGDGETTGSLTATGGYFAAAIGGSANTSVENISISGGTVTAIGGRSSAGIGGGIDGSGSVTITGGKVNATGGLYGAGIGGGNRGSGTVNISGGYIKADTTDSSSTTAATIGDGDSCTSSDGSVTITGGYYAVGDTSKNTVCGVSVADNHYVAANENDSTKSAYPYIVRAYSDLEIYSTKSIKIDEDYTYKDNVLTILKAGTYTVTMAEGVEQTATDRIVVNADGAVTLTIDDVNISNSADSGLRMSGGDLTLVLSGDNYIESTNEDYEAVSQTLEDYSLKITSVDGDGETTGSLTATGGDHGAGIGGGYGASAYNITIAGGTITATGGKYSAGIGGYSTANNITITGGIVNATGGTKPGIGGDVTDNITITGGVINAESTNGAGIGSGALTSGSSGITISGGTVNAVSYYGSGIGGGIFSDYDGITITGGVINAVNTDGSSPGIGGGNISYGVTNITITGGTVTAEGTVSIGDSSYFEGTHEAVVIDGGSVKAPNGFSADPVNSSGETAYLYEIPDTTEGDSLTIDGTKVIESIVYHAEDDTSQYVYLAPVNTYGITDSTFYLLSYTDEEGTVTTKVESLGSSMEIPDAETLHKFAEIVNNGGNVLNGTVTADIDFTGYTDMIGSSAYPYSGTFDGGGHTITVGYDITSGKRYIGLFGCSDGGTIQNLNVEGYIDFTNAPDPGTDSEDDKTGYAQVGGVVGYMNNGTISNVVSDVDITSSKTYPLHLTGGIVGSLYDSSAVDRCIYTGNLTAYKSYDALGGIVGYTRQSCSITNCANLGSLSSTTGTTASGTATAPYLGGIVGYVNHSTFGGLKSCYNYGSVTADDTTYCGALVGWLRNSPDNLTNNYWLDTSAEKAYGANDKGYTEPESTTAADFESGKIAYLLNNGGSIWLQTIGTDDYPAFDGLTVYSTAVGYSNNESLGDVWNDGIVDNADAAAVLKYAGGIYTSDNVMLDLEAADVNNDSAVDMLDSIAILKALESTD